MSIVLALASCAGVQGASAATIYLCRNHGGGEFWSSAHCSKHNSLIIRLTTVPDGLPFQQQVDLAAAARAEGDRLVAPPPPPTIVNKVQGGSAGESECAALDRHIRSLEAQSRRLQSGPSQDGITAAKKAARDRQFALRCR